ncbi:thiol reductase thioredoxin [Weizmannia acidilactici]|uniref:Thiol reductase thioredoxin n=1 Tax=Weizmannia acidilactici TaxID=2607726 RepID=A0A5J4JKB4_9BACI|nr:thioredoxin family protein [Weizmannia acidilactici]GER66450.1 thiol reductase thioredoxin [Weizmannia acidilactici]GER69404.1 thiol reductase thioredoxin [Weizmannia acidilactici]GER72268.1 thiol reductase thioredoxin [Weizmannia acidilactici]
MEDLQSVEAFHELKESGAHIFLFSAVWCPDCRFLDPFMPEIEKEFSDYTFVHVDRDKFIDLCGELDVYGIPSFIAYRDGKEIGRFVSKDRKTKEEVENFIEGLA